MSIDSLYEGIIAKLKDQGSIMDISIKLLGLTENGDRVLYVYKLIEELKAFPKAIKVLKSNSVSTHYRNLGNNHYQTQRSVQNRVEKQKSWQYYNLSLLYAELDTDNYCFALANRSAAFLDLKKYKECLKDIEKVFTMKYPGKLKDKLLKRKTTCEEALTKQKNPPSHEEIEEILTLNYPKDNRYKCASSKLEVVFKKKMGRHVIAKEDIKVGEVLIDEDPYLTLLQQSQYLISCNYCLSRDLNLLPCDSCCYALYCSEECQNKAYEQYHKYECPLLATLIHMKFTKLELLSLRILLKARRDHSDWSALFHTIEEAEANEHNEFRGHVKEDKTWVYDSKYYASIHMLASNVEKRSVSDIFQKSVTAAVFLRLLEGTDFLKTGNVEEEEKIRKTVAGMLLLHVMTSPTNMHGITSCTQDAHGNYVTELNIASAPYAFHSLLNHSCAPNVVRFSKIGNGNMKCFALRPIRKGAQLFDNYGSHHAIEDRLSRQGNLKFQYKFHCACEACCDNWPTYFGLRPARDLPVAIRKEKEQLVSPKAIEKLQKGDSTVALELYTPLCQLAEKLEPFIPCKELADVQEMLKQCLAIFQGIVPCGYSNLVDWSAIPPKVK